LSRLSGKRRRNFLASEKARATDPSQVGEGRLLEFMIAEFKKAGMHFSGTFLELGGNSAYDLSISWYLENKLGYHGVTVEPIPLYAYEYKAFRPKTKLFQNAVISAGSEDEEISFYSCNAAVLSTLDEAEVERYKAMGYTFTKIVARTIKINHLVDYFKERIDVLILDIESSSLQLKLLSDVISYLPPEKMPAIICVETLDYSRNSLNMRHSYDQLLARYYQFMAGTYLNSIYVHKLVECHE
jgi:hypothetical protein